MVFRSKKIRRIWFKDEWYYSLVDIVGALTDSSNPTDYLKKMRKRDAGLGSYLGTNCPQVEMLTETGLSTNEMIMKLSEFLKKKDNKENYALQDAIATGYPVFGNQLHYEAILQ